MLATRYFREVAKVAK